MVKRWDFHMMVLFSRNGWGEREREQKSMGKAWESQTRHSVIDIRLIIV